MLRLFLASSAVTRVLPASPSSASAFSIDATQIVLTQEAPSMYLKLKNESDEPMRFKLTACSWSPDPKGAMAMWPTDDLAFLPPQLTLGPKESRKICIEAAAEFSIRERTYRIFVEELPPVAARGDDSARVRGKIGIPVYMEPASMRGQRSMRELGLMGGVLTFALHNAGNGQVLPKTVLIRGFNNAGTVVFEHSVESQYVFADGKRDLEVRLPTVASRTVTALSVIVPACAKAPGDALDTPITAVAS